MSDSDVDLLPNNVFTFQNESTTVSARGPNINASNLTGLSFRNNIMTSTMNMPRNFERQKYLEQSYDQRSMYYRRETSPPLSLHSASSFRPRNYQHMYRPRGMSSQRSMINGRSGSPMSMRSMDSNATVSATDIAMAFKNMNFNKYDLRVIKDAYNQFMKRKMRRKIEKRRNLRLFMKGHRRKSGYDSGELGSDSSISSDDCRSTRTSHTSVYRDNMSSCRSTKTDLSDIRRTMKEGNLYKDCTENFRHNTFKNMLGVAPKNTSTHTQNRMQNDLPATQKDRFKNGFLLPSQRFNQSVASVPIPEKQNRIQNAIPNQRAFETNATRDSSGMESEQEEIFSEITIREKSVCNIDIQKSAKGDPRKRCLEFDEERPSNKRSKISSPPKILHDEITFQGENNNNKNNPKEFEFLKPQFPIRKSGNIKVKEKLLAKSSTPFIDEAIATNNVPKPQAEPQSPENNMDKTKEDNEQQPDLTQHSNSDVSMRPSFIKRKLYTQKFDVLESKNMSSDHLVNSPQTNVYSAIQKEKNKARKLVTNQSCLSRDVRDDNLLDLIHKIVPPDRMNVTNVTNKSEIANSSAKNKTDDNRWDVTSIITTCNNDDGSDTYTDEEIFKNENSGRQLNNENMKTTAKKSSPAGKLESKKISPSKKKSPISKKSPNKTKLPISKKSPSKSKSPRKQKTEIKILVEKLPNGLSTLEKNKPVSVEAISDKIKGNVYNCVKSFWDTDFESDFEGNSSEKKVKEKENNCNQGNLTIVQTRIQSNKTLDSTQSKFVWNSNNAKPVTLKSHNFSSQIKPVNVNKSFTKRTMDKKDQKKEHTKPAKTTENPKKLSKKFVLDTYNSTVSDNTQNETVINANNKKHVPPTKKTETTKKNHNPKSQVAENANLTTHSTSVEKTKQKAGKTQPEKAKSKNAKNGKAQSKDDDKRNTSKRSAPSPKQFTCCTEPANKKDKKETQARAKNNKTILGDYNSTLSDNTLDEIIKNGNRTRALRATRLKNIENSILDDLRRDDSHMLNMTLRSRQLNTSFTKAKNDKTKAPTKAEEKARNTSKISQTKEIQSRQNKTLVTPVKVQKAVTKKSVKKHSPKVNTNVRSTPKRNVKRK